MNLRSLKNDLTVKTAGLTSAERTLEIFSKQKPLNKQAINETVGIIRELKGQIADIKKNIKQLEKRAAKKT